MRRLFVTPAHPWPVFEGCVIAMPPVLLDGENKSILIGAVLTQTGTDTSERVRACPAGLSSVAPWRRGRRIREGESETGLSLVLRSCEKTVSTRNIQATTDVLSKVKRRCYRHGRSRKANKGTVTASTCVSTGLSSVALLAKREASSRKRDQGLSFQLRCYGKIAG